MKTIRYSQLVMPQDANVFGTLFGGQMVSWMDISASKAVHRFLKKSEADAALTRAIDAIEFKETVNVGDWVNFEANIISTGKSSIVIKIDAYKESKEIDKVIKNFFFADAQSAIAPRMGDTSAIIIEATEFAIPNCKVL